VVDRRAVRLTDPHAQAGEVLRAQLADDRAETVVATRASRPAEAKATQGQRKVVHDHLAERAGIETFSEGDEPNRCVIVAPLVGNDDDDD